MSSTVVPISTPVDSIHNMSSPSSTTLVSSSSSSSPASTPSSSPSRFPFFSFSSSTSPSSSTASSSSVPAPSSLSSSSSPASSLTDLSLSTLPFLSAMSPPSLLTNCWGGIPPLYHTRARLLMYTTRPFLIPFFTLQLTLHTLYLATSILLIARPHLLTDMWISRQDESVLGFSFLQYLPWFLVVRSLVSIPVSVRRLILLQSWRSTRVDSYLCVSLLACTCVMGVMALVGVAQLPSNGSWMYVGSWMLVGSMLLLAGWQLAMYAVMLFFFPRELVTICAPILPLAAHQYMDETPSKPKKNEGLTQEQLHALPLSVYQGERDDACCAVCMDDVEVGQVQRVLHCCHAFHQACIDPWLLKKRVCPLCVRAVRPSESRSSSGEWAVEMAEREKPQGEEERRGVALMV